MMKRVVLFAGAIVLGVNSLHAMQHTSPPDIACLAELKYQKWRQQPAKYNSVSLCALPAQKLQKFKAKVHFLYTMLEMRLKELQDEMQKYRVPTSYRVQEGESLDSVALRHQAMHSNYFQIQEQIGRVFAIRNPIRVFWEGINAL